MRASRPSGDRRLELRHFETARFKWNAWEVDKLQAAATCVHDPIRAGSAHRAHRRSAALAALDAIVNAD